MSKNQIKIIFQEKVSFCRENSDTIFVLCRLLNQTVLWHFGVARLSLAILGYLAVKISKKVQAKLI